MFNGIWCNYSIIRELNSLLCVYEVIIAASFAQHNVGGLDSYLASNALPPAYVDVKNEVNSVSADSEYMNKVSTVWDVAAN